MEKTEKHLKIEEAKTEQKEVIRIGLPESWDKWDILILIGALIIIIWAILHILGVLKSPVWVNMIPYFAIGISLLGGTYKLGKIKKGIEITDKKVDKILENESRLDKIETEHNLAMNGKLKVKH